MKWLTNIDFIQKAIWITCMIEPILYVEDMGLASDIWKKFESLYQNNRFIECNAIFICFFTQIFSDFNDVVQFTDNIKRNSTRFKEIVIKNISDWQYTN